MAKWLRGFGAAWWIGWVALTAAGIGYARIRGVPASVTIPALTAFLVAYPFYLAPAFPSVRERFSGKRLPFFLVTLAVLPYLAATGSTGFHWDALAKLTVVALVLGLWFIVLPAGWLTDLGFLAAVAGLLLFRFFDGVYPKLYRGVDLSVLGKVFVFESAAIALMLARRGPETGFGFIPTWKDWRIGALHFLYFVPVGLPLALLIKAVKFTHPAPLWMIAGTFLAILWVLALYEEFFFRGILQPMFEKWTSRPWLALLITSCLFGLVHLSFRRAFPNWRWVLVAGTMGWFCGRARNKAGSIRAAMVTHALTVAAWRAFFV